MPTREKRKKLRIRTKKSKLTSKSFSKSKFKLKRQSMPMPKPSPYKPAAYAPKEKIILLCFLVFAIIAMIILFKAPQPFMTGSALLSSELEKASFNASEPLRGDVSLQLEEGDLLPSVMTVNILITRDVVPSQTNYVCPSGKTIPYRDENGTLITADPESWCCKLYGGADCWQVIIDSGFEESLFIYNDLRPNWRFVPTLAQEQGLAGVDFDLIDEEETAIAWLNSLEGKDVSIGQKFAKTKIGFTGLTVTGYLTVPMPVNGNGLDLERTCKDSDADASHPNGKNYVKAGKCDQCIDDACTRYTDRCSQDGTILTEYYCYGTRCRSETKICQQCSGGACIDTCTIVAGGSCRSVCLENEVEVTELDSMDSIRICPFPKQVCCMPEGIPPTCTDGGDDLFIKGICTSGDSLTHDYCNSDGNLMQASCNPTTKICEYSDPISCPSGYFCEAGACKKTPRNLILSWLVKYETYYDNEGCAFELIVKGKSEAGEERNLHYYYTINNIEECRLHDSTSTNKDKYIELENPSMGEWQQYSENLTDDWIDFGWDEEDPIEELWFVSYGNETGCGYNQGEACTQLVSFDDIKLRRGPEPSSQCLERGKKCCLAGTGIGSFYGEQLNCSEGYECWDECTDRASLNLVDFKSKSDFRTKENRAVGPYKCIGCVNTWQDYLGGSDYDYGRGYAACPDTSSSAPLNCRDWNNQYTVDIYNKIRSIGGKRLEIPSQNGTYLLTVQLRYTPPNDVEKIFYETSAPFTVGAPAAPPTCPNTDYNFTAITNWSDWGDCIAGQQTRTRILQGIYIGTANCASVKNKTDTGTQTCYVVGACTEADWDCSDWTPSICLYQGTQTRTCNLQADSTCDESLIQSYVPETQRTCTTNVLVEYATAQETAGYTRSDVKNDLAVAGWSDEDINNVLDTVYGKKEKPKLSWYVWVIIIMVLVVAIALLVWKVILPKKPRAAKPAAKEEAYPELTSYIKDALATGATKPEIIAKLVEAGWPKNSIEKAFKIVR